MPDYSRKWIGKAKESLDKVSDKNRFDVFHWIEFHRSKLELNKALECCDFGIEDAHKTQKIHSCICINLVRQIFVTE